MTLGRGIDPSPSGEPPDVLVVQVDGNRSEPTRLFTVARPTGGMVWVREWRSDGAEHESTAERQMPAAELYALFERALDARRRVSEDLYRIRQWLAGSAPE